MSAFDQLSPSERRFAHNYLQQIAAFALDQELERVRGHRQGMVNTYGRLTTAHDAVKQDVVRMDEELLNATPKEQKEDTRLRAELENLLRTYLDREVQRRFARELCQAVREEPQQARRMVKEAPEWMLQRLEERHCQVFLQAKDPQLRRLGFRLLRRVEPSQNSPEASGRNSRTR